MSYDTNIVQEKWNITKRRSSELNDATTQTHCNIFEINLSPEEIHNFVADLIALFKYFSHILMYYVIDILSFALGKFVWDTLVSFLSLRKRKVIDHLI